MASQSASTLSVYALLVAVVALPLLVDATFGKIECESLGRGTCAYAVSWEGKRCVLEKHVRREGGEEEEYACTTSEIGAHRLRNWIESDRCVKACGLDRSVLGISSDSLLEAPFVRRLCSDACYAACPNVVHLYSDLAAGEGVNLPRLCEARGGNARREMAEIKSSGFPAAAAESPEYSNTVHFIGGPSVAYY